MDALIGHEDKPFVVMSNLLMVMSNLLMITSNFLMITSNLLMIMSNLRVNALNHHKFHRAMC